MIFAGWKDELMQAFGEAMVAAAIAGSAVAYQSAFLEVALERERIATKKVQRLILEHE